MCFLLSLFLTSAGGDTLLPLEEWPGRSASLHAQELAGPFSGVGSKIVPQLYRVHTGSRPVDLQRFDLYKETKSGESIPISTFKPGPGCFFAVNGQRMVGILGLRVGDQDFISTKPSTYLSLGPHGEGVLTATWPDVPDLYMRVLVFPGDEHLVIEVEQNGDDPKPVRCRLLFVPGRVNPGKCSIEVREQSHSRSVTLFDSKKDSISGARGALMLSLDHDFAFPEPVPERKQEDSDEEDEERKVSTIEDEIPALLEEKEPDDEIEKPDDEFDEEEKPIPGEGGYALGFFPGELSLVHAQPSGRGVWVNVESRPGQKSFHLIVRDLQGMPNQAAKRVLRELSWPSYEDFVKLAARGKLPAQTRPIGTARLAKGSPEFVPGTLCDFSRPFRADPEELDARPWALPEGWSFDIAHGHESPGCLRADHSASRISTAQVSLNDYPVGDAYNSPACVVTGWLKTSGLEGRGVSLGIVSHVPYFKEQFSAPVNGTTNWTRVSIVTSLLPFLQTGSLAVRMEGKGFALVDEIRITPLLYHRDAHAAMSFVRDLSEGWKFKHAPSAMTPTLQRAGDWKPLGDSLHPANKEGSTLWLMRTLTLSAPEASLHNLFISLARCSGKVDAWLDQTPLKIEGLPGEPTKRALARLPVPRDSKPHNLLLRIKDGAFHPPIFLVQDSVEAYYRSLFGLREGHQRSKQPIGTSETLDNWLGSIMTLPPSSIPLPREPTFSKASGIDCSFDEETQPTPDGRGFYMLKGGAKWRRPMGKRECGYLVLESSSSDGATAIVRYDPAELSSKFPAAAEFECHYILKVDEPVDEKNSRLVVRFFSRFAENIFKTKPVGRKRVVRVKPGSAIVNDPKWRRYSRTVDRLAILSASAFALTFKGTGRILVDDLRLVPVKPEDEETGPTKPKIRSWVDAVTKDGVRRVGERVSFRIPAVEKQKHVLVLTQAKWSAFSSVREEIPIARNNYQAHYMIPGDLPPGNYTAVLYRGAADGKAAGPPFRVQVINPELRASVALFTPHLRQVFYEGEEIEVSAAVRTEKNAPPEPLSLWVQRARPPEKKSLFESPDFRSFERLGERLRIGRVAQLKTSGGRCTATFVIGSHFTQSLDPGLYFIEAEYGKATSRPLETRIVSSVRRSKFPLVHGPYYSGDRGIPSFSQHGGGANSFGPAPVANTFIEKCFGELGFNIATHWKQGQQPVTREPLNSRRQQENRKTEATHVSIPPVEGRMPDLTWGVTFDRFVMNQVGVVADTTVVDWIPRATVVPSSLAEEMRHTVLLSQALRAYPCFVGLRPGHLSKLSYSRSIQLNQHDFRSRKDSSEIEQLLWQRYQLQERPKVSAFRGYWPHMWSWYEWWGRFTAPEGTTFSPEEESWRFYRYVRSIASDQQVGWSDALKKTCPSAFVTPTRKYTGPNTGLRLYSATAGAFQGSQNPWWSMEGSGVAYLDNTNDDFFDPFYWSFLLPSLYHNQQKRGRPVWMRPWGFSGKAYNHANVFGVLARGGVPVYSIRGGIVGGYAVMYAAAPPFLNNTMFRGTSGAREHIRKTLRLLSAYGPTFASLKQDTPLAILVSNTQQLKKAPQPLWEAMTALLFAHHPAVAVSEEEIAKGDLSRHRVLFIPHVAVPLPDKVVEGMKQFISKGGKIFTDKTTKLSLDGVRKLDVAFDNFFPARANAEGWYTLGWAALREPIMEYLDRLKPALDEALPLSVESESPDVFPFRFRGGEVDYFVAVNHLPRGRGRSIMDNRTRISFPSARGALYDVIAMEQLPDAAPPKSTRSTDVLFHDLGVRIYAHLPQPISSIRLSAPEKTERGYEIPVKVSVMAGDAPVPGPVPIAIELVDPSGAIRHQLNRCCTPEDFSIVLKIGSNAPPGAWKLKARELISGLMAETDITVDERGEALPVDDVHHLANPVQVYDLAAIRELLAYTNSLIIPANPKASFDELTEALSSRRIKPTVVAPHLLELFLTRTMWQDLPVARGPEADVRGHMILAGTPKDHFLLEQITSFDLLIRNLSPNYPGPGRAVIQYVRSAFSYGSDVILVLATDAAGVREGLASLTRIVRGKEEAESFSTAHLEKVRNLFLPPDYRAYREAELGRPLSVPQRLPVAQAPLKTTVSKSRKEVRPMADDFGSAVKAVDFAPDGKSILVRTDSDYENLFRVGLDGKILLRRIVGRHTGEVKWLPDGRLLAISGSKVVLYDSDGREQLKKDLGETIVTFTDIKGRPVTRNVGRWAFHVPGTTRFIMETRQHLVCFDFITGKEAWSYSYFDKDELEATNVDQESELKDEDDEEDVDVEAALDKTSEKLLETLPEVRRAEKRKVTELIRYEAARPRIIKSNEIAVGIRWVPIFKNIYTQPTIRAGQSYTYEPLPEHARPFARSRIVLLDANSGKLLDSLHVVDPANREGYPSDQLDIYGRFDRGWRPFPIFEVSQSGALLTTGRSWYAFGEKDIPSGLPRTEMNEKIFLAPDATFSVVMPDQSRDWNYRCTIHFTDSRQPKTFHPLEAFRHTAISPDSKRLLLTNWDGTVFLFDNKGTELARISAGTGAMAAFSPDGDQFVLGTDHGRLMIYGVADGTKRWETKLGD